MFPRVSELYRQRLVAQDPSRKKLYKLLMNSAYGKYGEKEHPIDHYLPTEELRAAMLQGPDHYQAFLDQILRGMGETRNVGIQGIQEYENGLARIRFSDTISGHRTPVFPANPRHRTTHIAS